MRSPDDLMNAVTDSMAERTGRTLQEWVPLVATSGVKQNGQWVIADAAARAAGWVWPTVEEYVDAQYTGAKAALRPIFDAVRGAVLALGDDVVVEGRGTYVPFVRRRQFAAVAAATATRIDLGLRLPDPPSGGRLQAATAPGSATHRVQLFSVADVDEEVRSLLRAAYDQNG